MPKVIRRVINHRYTAINPAFLAVDSVIDFDCFIKRYDDFVIIIESGTLITAELLHKVQQNESIYILKHDSEKVQIYKHAYGTNIYTVSLKDTESESLDVMNLKKNIESLSNYEQKLELVYQTTASLLESIFEGKSETLPLEAIKLCVESIVHCINFIDNPVMPKVLHLMPNEYSTHHHSTNVAIFSTILGKSIGISKSELIDLAYAGLMHDIGKIRIDKMLLLKPSELDDNEYELVQNHSAYGVEILQKNGIENQKILDAVLHHHEKLDGKGYPDQLRGKRIPKFARIIGMCDVFDALTTHRTYRMNYTSYEALMLMKQQMTDQFDIQYSETFIRLLSPTQS